MARTHDDLRRACRLRLAEVPAAGLEEALELLQEVRDFYLARAGLSLRADRPPPSPSPLRLGEPSARPDFAAEGDP